jgi:hypothetical protein
VLGRPAKDGKKFGGNHRNYSSLWEQDWRAPVFGDDGTSAIGYCNASKGQKPLIRAFIERQHPAPWFAAIAESGQKHLIPFAPMNGMGRSGLVLFEEQIARIPEDVQLIARATELLTAGATKDELLSGDYSPRAWQLATELLREFDRDFAGERGGPWFALAIWLAQRDEETVSARIEAEKAERAAKKEKANAGRKAKRAPENRNRGTAARGKNRVPADARSEPAEALGATSESLTVSGAHKRNAGGMGDATATPTSDPKHAQLGLFGADGSRSCGDGTKGRKRMARPR